MASFEATTSASARPEPARALSLGMANMSADLEVSDSSLRRVSDSSEVCTGVGRCGVWENGSDGFQLCDLIRKWKPAAFLHVGSTNTQIREVRRLHFRASRSATWTGVQLHPRTPRKILRN